jgi:hypothetical protein
MFHIKFQQSTSTCLWNKAISLCFMTDQCGWNL